MSTSSFDPAQSQQPAYGGTDPAAGGGYAEPPGSAPAPAPSGPVSPGGRGRTIALVGGILAIVAVGAGATYAFQQVSGGGAQPESVMPANAFAFAKVDLDPSAGQKLDAIRFIRTFPDAQGQVKEDSDLREVVFKGLQDDGELTGVDYAKDVEPWLGQRLGFGVVPGSGAEAKPTVLVALSVTDKAAAEKSLPTLAASMEGACQVLEEYAVCTEEKDALAGIISAAGKDTLADSANFSKDMADLGEDGVASAWFDSKELAKVAGTMGGSAMFGMPTTTRQAGQGRAAMALRFDGPHLELAGHVNDAPTPFVSGDTAASIGDLPKGTLAAMSVANAGDQLKAAWPELGRSLKGAAGEQEFADGLAEIEGQLGISLPEDLYAALGSQFTLAFGGMGEGQSEVKVAVVTNGDKAVLQKLADAAGEQMGAGGLTLKSADKRTVVSLSDGYADEVASGSGLRDAAGFKDSVRDLDDAQVAGYVDIAGVLAAFKDEIPADEAKSFQGLSALGFTLAADGDSADFALRLTTR